MTEDADLGVRLARLGYRTEIVATTTHEEANCRALPWVKQRSRWLKGFAMTWGVHMRAPGRLVREIGFWPTLGFHLQMFATVQQFLLAPVLWSFWLLTLGLGHPLGPVMDGWWGKAVIATFLLSEALNVVVWGGEPNGTTPLGFRHAKTPAIVDDHRGRGGKAILDGMSAGSSKYVRRMGQIERD